MGDPLGFSRRVTMDLALLALAGAIPVLVVFGSTQSAGFVCSTLWTAINFLALSWLVISLMSGKSAPRLFIFALACAKIPASYYLLFWLFRVDYLGPAGLVAGLTTLPVVLLFRGLTAAREQVRQENTSE